MLIQLDFWQSLQCNRIISFYLNHTSTIRWNLVCNHLSLTLIQLYFHEVFIKTTNCEKKTFSIWCSFIRFCSNSVHPDRFPFFCQEICLTWLFFSISGHFQDKSSYILSYIGGAPTKRGNPMSKISSKWSSRIWERESAANFKGATQLQTVTTNNNTANWKKKRTKLCCGQSHFLHKKAY